MRNHDFWDMEIEDVMGCNMEVGEQGRTLPCDSDTTPFATSDTYYSRSHIAQLSLHEESAEELIQGYSRVAGRKSN